MQKRKFDELISHFNRKVSDMSIDQKYKMELLGMISAIGFAHEKELSTNLAGVGTDCISRQAAIDALIEYGNGRAVFISVGEAVIRIKQLPPIQPEPHWIPVTGQPPEIGKSVLICDAYGDIYLGHRANYGYYFPDFCDDKIKDVRAWCELPEPFKGVTT